VRSVRPVVSAILAVFCIRAASADDGPRFEVPGFYPGDAGKWSCIASSRPPVSFGPDLAGIIVPHHMADQEYLAAVWHGVSLVRSPKLIVIFSPDHFSTASTSATAPRNTAYPTPFGTVETSVDLAGKLAERGLVRLSDSPFQLEHGIFAHTGFIARYFPGVRILPILLGWDTGREVLDGLVSALEELAPADTFFAASVDFSHHVPVEVSVFHDISSEKAVLNLDREEFYDLEIDSPPSLYAVSSLMEDRGSARALRFLWTQLQNHYPYPISDNTSHLYFAYYPGKPQTVRAVSLMVFPESAAEAASGKLVPDTLLDRWPPRARVEDRQAPGAGAAAPYPYLVDLRGKENRFLKGSDLYLFDLAPGLVVDRTVSGMRVTVVTLAAEDALQRNPARIAGLARGCDVLLVVDCDARGAARARWPELAAAGARVIIGRGGGAPAAWRVENGVLFVDSLGQLRKGGNSFVPSSALGVYLDEGGCRVWEFPLSFRRGNPVYRDTPEAGSYTRVTKTPMERE
jgi:AmmeMemoRadiSam system protein B